MCSEGSNEKKCDNGCNGDCHKASDQTEMCIVNSTAAYSQSREADSEGSDEQRDEADDNEPPRYGASLEDGKCPVCVLFQQ